MQSRKYLHEKRCTQSITFPDELRGEGDLQANIPPTLNQHRVLRNLPFLPFPGGGQDVLNHHFDWTLWLT